LSSWKKENDNGEAKSDDEGKKEQKQRREKKILVVDRGLKYRVPD
jgi:hypothetical protein